MWASEGECESNPRVLNLQCPMSCGLCMDVASLVKDENAKDENVKDEL
jgi:hypothetical protein